MRSRNLLVSTILLGAATLPVCAANRTGAGALIKTDKESNVLPGENVPLNPDGTCDATCQAAKDSKEKSVASGAKNVGTKIEDSGGSFGSGLIDSLKNGTLGGASGIVGPEPATAEVQKAQDSAQFEYFDPEHGTVVKPTDAGYNPKLAPKAVPGGTLADGSPDPAHPASVQYDPKMVAAAQQALANDPANKDLRAFVELAKPQGPAHVSDKTVKDRLNTLMSMVRGNSGDEVPPGAALTSKPELASALAFPGLGAAGARPMTAEQLAGLNALSRGGVRLQNPLVTDAASKFQIRDFPGAESLLTRRLGENPQDEPAWRLRALTRRQMKRYEPSADDAKQALTLVPADSRARRILIEDWVDLGRSQEALSEANNALAANPKDAQVLAARATVWASLGDRERQLADLKEAAAQDVLFDQLYESALAGNSAPVSKRPRPTAVWLGAVGTALLFFSFAIFRKRGDSSVRVAMRAEDRAHLERAARPDAAPAGFKIVKTLGQGGMGVVYEAVDLGLQRTVALKKLRAEIADSPRERARFLKEARTVAALKHPNIVEIHAIHEDAEGLFLVFEKVLGETLHERLGHGALAPAEAVHVLRQVAKALDCAHSSGVVHQDLKPANIMVHGDTAKVMDFGIARRVQETLSTLSRIEVAGTPAYMAPEQERGGAVGPAADVFALGACAYETLAGRTPFPSGGLMMKAEKLYRPLSEVVPSLPKAADEAIARALDPDPMKRWPSAASFVEALSRSLAVPA